MSNIQKLKKIKTLEEQTNSLNTEVNRIQIKKDLAKKELISKKEKFNALVREKNIDIKKLEELKGEISLEVLSIKEKKNKALKEKQSVEKELIARKERLSTLNDSINIIVYEENKREAEYKTKLEEIETFVSVNELKQKHENCLSRIDALKKEADLIVDLIQEINDDEKIDLTIKEIPVKLITLIK